MKKKPSKKKKLTYAESEKARIAESYKSDPKRVKTFCKQIDERGWCQEEIWSLDYQFVLWFVPRLEELIKNKFSYDVNKMKFQSEEEKTSYLKYKQNSMDMLEGFKNVYVEKDFFSSDWGFSKNAPKDVKVRYRKVMKSLKLFKELFYGMWI
jgi:hypothetical protein